MNVRDSEVICGLLEKDGYEFTEDSGKADVILFNTCSVRRHAEDKVWSEIGRIAKSKTTKIKIASPPSAPRNDTFVKPIIGLVGCMAQNYKEAVFERAPDVDFAAGPQDIQNIPQILKRLFDNRGQNITLPLELKIWETGSESRPEEIYHTGFYNDKDHAYVVISEGCSNYCSYCIVPYVRGELRNRHHKDILKEIEEAIDKGITGITLLGQNVNSYVSPQRGEDKRIDFIGLIKLVDEMKGLEEFDFITSHPRDTSVELFKAMQDAERLKKFLHLPVQSGSDKILKLMNRGYTRKYYLELIGNYRKIVKDGVLTTDIIVGFPMETKDDFQATYDLVKDAQFDAAFIFKYSARPYTNTAGMADDVAKEEKERRHKIILDLQKEISIKRKAQSEKRKAKTQSLKLLVLSFSLAFCALSSALPCYALSLDKLKANFLRGDYKAAIQEGEKILAEGRNSPGMEELYYFLGLSYMKNGDYLRASDIFEIILKEFKGNLFKNEAALGLADTFFLRGDYAKAMAGYQELLDTQGAEKLRGALYYRLSRCAFNLGDIEKGKEFSDKLNKECPKNFESGLTGDSVLSLDFYSIQVGSFASRANAESLRGKLIKNNYDAYIEEAITAASKSYRVKVGRLKSRSQAVELEDKLSKEGYPTKITP